MTQESVEIFAKWLEKHEGALENYEVIDGAFDAQILLDCGCRLCKELLRIENQEKQKGE